MGMDDEIMVVRRDVLFKDKSFQGIVDADFYDYIDVILNNFTFKIRRLAEQDYELKQPIAYGIIVNEKGDIYAYKRAHQGYNESRLRGKWSIGLGGHIEKYDLNDNPILTSLMRELDEEVKLNAPIDDFKVIAYINDDSNDVGRVHFGIVYLLKTKATEAKPNDQESKVGFFIPFEKLNELQELESWSELAFKFLKEHKILR